MPHIKILRIIDRMNIGGPAVHVVVLTAGLDKERFTSLLLTGGVDKSEGDMSYLAQKYAVEPMCISHLGRKISLFSDLLALWKILRVIYREKPHIVHTHKSKAGFLGRLAAIILRVPVLIHTFHGHIFHSYFGKWKTRLFLLLERFLARFTDRIVVISKHQFSEICGVYRIARPGKFVVVPLGFDFTRLMELEKHNNSLRRKWNIGAEILTVGIIGRLTAVKNHAMFLEVARQILQGLSLALVPDRSAGTEGLVKFLIIGDGELKQTLMAMAQKMSIEKHVIFTGWIESPGEIYSDLDIVALTSLNEGTPVTLIEAMFCKKPVVATQVGGVCDVVQDQSTGFLIKKGDIEEFCRALKILLADPVKRREMGERGHLLVREKYSQQRLVRDMEKLYIALLRG